MADKKISQLSAASTPLAGTEVLPIVQSSATVKVATNDLTVRNVRANATTGILQVAGPAAAATRVMTVPDANFTAARTDAGQTFTGVQVMTSPRIVTSIDDTNGNELFGITATASAVNELTVANAATGNRPTISATGSDTNIGIALTPKGAGDVAFTTGNLILGTLGNGINLPYAAIKSSNTSGDFVVTVSGLSTLSGAAWRKCSMLVYYAGIDGTVSNGTDLLTIVELAGLSTYSAAVQANIVGTATITSASASNNGIAVTFDVSNSNAGSVMVFLLGGAEGASPQISIAP